MLELCPRCGKLHYQTDACATIAVALKKLGRPRIHPDRKAYKAQKERERRAKAKA